MNSFGEYPCGTGDPVLRHELTGFETAKVNRSQRGNQGGQGSSYQGNGNAAAQSGPQDDPWGIPAASNAGGGWSAGPDSEPPF